MLFLELGFRFPHGGGHGPVSSGVPMDSNGNLRDGRLPELSVRMCRWMSA